MAISVVELCKQKEVTIEQLTEQSGLDYNRVAAIATGRWTPTPEERKKIAAVFEADPAEIGWGHTVPIQHIYGHGPG